MVPITSVLLPLFGCSLWCLKGPRTPPNLSRQVRKEQKAHPEEDQGGRTRPYLGSSDSSIGHGGDFQSWFSWGNGGRGKPHADNVLKVNEIK